MLYIKIHSTIDNLQVIDSRKPNWALDELIRTTLDIDVNITYNYDMWMEIV